MSRRAVTAAQIKRAWEAISAKGETVRSLINHPDGRVEFALTSGGNATLPSAEQAEAAWDKALGLQ